MSAETQSLLFELPPCGSTIPDEVDEMIAAGVESATLIEWDGNATDAIQQAVIAFCARGWAWDGDTLRRDGWKAWFRSQGWLSSPILQWSRAA